MKNILSILFLGLSSILYSQEKITIPDISKDLVIFINSIEHDQKKETKISHQELDLFWSSLIAVNNSNNDKMLKHKTKEIKSLHGLRMLLYANTNFEEAIDDNEDISYSSRAYAGLEWEFLRNGLFNSINKSKKSEYENKVKSVKAIRNSLKYREYYGHLKIENIFNYKIKKILSKKLILEKKIHYLYRLLSFEKHITKEEVLDKLEKLYSTENKLKNIESNDTSKVSIKSLPYLEINTKSIRKQLKENKLDSILLTNKVESLNTSNFILNNWSLRPNIRYNYYNRAEGSVKTYTSVGISLSLPLSTGSNARKSKRYEITMLNNEAYYKKRQNEEELQKLIDYGVQKQGVLLNKIKNKSILDIKANSIKNRMHISPCTASGLEYLEMLSNQLSTEISILETNKLLYKNLLDISICLDGVNPSLIYKEINIKNKYRRIQDERYVYIWSKFAKNTSATKLGSYLKEADIKNALISFKDIKKKKEYINYLTNNDINVELLIGNNSIMKRDSIYIQNYIKSKLNYNIKGIHLDIEPHIFKDWKRNKEIYYKKLIQIYSIAKKECIKKDIKLSVSIPVFYNRNFLNKIKPLCDKVFVMAYGTSDPNKIMRRIKEELEIIGPDSLVLALNNVDFSKAIERELVIDALKKHTHCKAIAYHKAATLFYINKSK